MCVCAPSGKVSPNYREGNYAEFNYGFREAPKIKYL
jgi:hypothetical protein